jgi:hypothetical protein
MSSQDFLTVSRTMQYITRKQKGEQLVLSILG